jgi:hypothetical protein
LIFDIAIIILAFLILKILKKIPVLKLLLYIAVVYINGMICDIVSVFAISFINNCYDSLTNSSPFNEQNDIMMITIFILFSAFVLFITNYFYAKLILKQDKKKSIIIGLIIAIFTNPVIGLFINFNDSFYFYQNLF